MPLMVPSQANVKRQDQPLGSTQASLKKRLVPETPLCGPLALACIMAPTLEVMAGRWQQTLSKSSCTLYDPTPAIRSSLSLWPVIGPVSKVTLAGIR